MAFYWTVGSDMPNEEIIVVRPALQGKKSDDFGPDSQAFLPNGMEKSPSQVKAILNLSERWNVPPRQSMFILKPPPNHLLVSVFPLFGL